MSTQNDLINYQNVIKEANSLINEQIKLWGGVVSSIQKVGKVTPSSFVNAQKQVNQALEKSIELETKLEVVEKKRQATVQQGLNTGSSLYRQREKELALVERKAQAEEKGAAREEKANERRRLSDIQLQRQREQAFDKFERNLAKEQALLERSENVYNKVQQKVNALTATYNNLATRKELGRKLTDQELSQLNSLEGRLNRYNEVLKKVDAQIGNNRRNVGNYASGWNGLGNSINQITRELPAFTFSAQTGFLALSNNIPILADEIQRVSKNVKELRAQGQQVPSVMSQILTSFLSWQTALSIGVTLITVYGKEIGNFFTEMFKGSKIIDSTTKLLETYNKTLKDGDYEKAYTDVAKVAIAFDQARAGVISKRDALRVYNDVLGDVMGRTEDFTKAENTLNAQARNYVDATMAKAQANILLSESAKLAAENVELQGNTEVTWAEQTKAWLQSGAIFSRFTDPFNEKVMDNRTNRIKTNTEQINANKKAAEELFKQFQTLSKDLNVGTLFTDGNNNTNTPKTKDDAENNLKEQLDIEYRLQVARINQMEEGTDKELELLQAWYDYQQTLNKDNAKELLIIQLDYWSKLKKINDDAYKTENEAFIKSNDELEKEFEQWEKEYNEGYDAFLKNRQEWKDKADEAYLKSEAEKDEKFIQQLQKTRDYLDQSTDLNIFGFGSLNIFTQLEENGKTAFENMLENAQDFKEKFAVITNAVGDILKDVFNAMEERQNAYFDTQFKNLETEKDLALQFAGENTAGREAIERQYEEKKRALQMQQARQQKQMAMLQATINIAQGITSALAQAPPYSFILAALVGVLGAVQLAKISSTPLPQYADGREGGSAEWAITQEKGAEMITDSKGNIKTLGNSKGSQLTYLNKGDKVFTADETTQKLNELLISSGVSPIVNVSGGSGLTEEQMRNIMQDTLAKQPKNSIIFDENGIKAFTSKENRRTILKNRNVRI